MAFQLCTHSAHVSSTGLLLLHFSSPHHGQVIIAKNHSTFKIKIKLDTPSEHHTLTVIPPTPPTANLQSWGAFQSFPTSKSHSLSSLSHPFFLIEFKLHWPPLVPVMTMSSTLLPINIIVWATITSLLDY